VAGHPVSRQVAQVTLEALKKAGHILLAPGGTEAVLRELSQLIDPVIPRVLAKLDFSPIMGEVSSTFGDEATDEAVEALVEEMREALLDSDGVEDVFADDRTIERMIFRTFAETSRTLARTAQEEDEDDELPPISVKLDTLGYVAAAAAKSADDGTLREALDRAAEAAQSELKTFDEKSLTAFFKPVDPDPDRRLDIESAIEEELSDLVDLGVVELPTVKRTLPLPALGDAERKTLRRRLDELAQRHLGAAHCPGTWDWSHDKRAVDLVFTPLSEPDAALIEGKTDAFRADLAAALVGLEGAQRPAPSDDDDSSAEVDVSFAMRVLKAAGLPAPPAKKRPATESPAAAAGPPASRSARAKAPPEKAAPKPSAARAVKKAPKPTTADAPPPRAPAKKGAKAPSRKRP
jgi:hypothetical protein